MFNFLLGAAVMAGLLFLINFIKKKQLHLTWWQWVLTILGIGYVVFVLEVIAGFARENAYRASLIMGIILGLIAVIWGTLLTRYVFLKVIG